MVVPWVHTPSKYLRGFPTSLVVPLTLILCLVWTPSACSAWLPRRHPRLRAAQHWHHLPEGVDPGAGRLAATGGRQPAAAAGRQGEASRGVMGVLTYRIPRYIMSSNLA